MTRKTLGFALIGTLLAAAATATALPARRSMGHAANRAAAVGRVRVQVLNATKTRGLARRAMLYLRDQGFDVVEAAKKFDRRVTFEYVMLGGVNDAVEHAIRLAELARECRAFVNLIPLHPGGARGFVPTPAERIREFAQELRSYGVEVAIRKSRGVDIAAACGQLRVERLGRRPPRGPDEHGHVQVA